MLGCLEIFSSPSLLVVGISIPDLLVLHSSIPRYSSLQVQLNRLVYIGVSGREKLYGNFNKTDADFIVSSEVYELLLTRF